MSERNELLEAIVTPKEQKIIDVISKGDTKLDEIIKVTGIGRTVCVDLLKVMREMGWVIHLEQEHLWRVNPDITFRCVRIHNGQVMDEGDRRRIMERVPLKATFANKENDKRFVDTSLKFSMTSPEEFRQGIINDRKHLKHIEVKKGVYKLNENYNPDNSTRRTSGAG